MEIVKIDLKKCNLYNDLAQEEDYRIWKPSISLGRGKGGWFQQGFEVSLSPPMGFIFPSLVGDSSTSGQGFLLVSGCGEGSHC